MKEISNTDLCLWAMYSLGAHERSVDVEEIYLRLFEIAPKKFSWRTRPDLPNMRNGLTALGKLEKDVFPEFVIKVSPRTRMLSDLGVRWIESQSARFEGLSVKEGVLPSRYSDDARTVRRIESSQAWQDWGQGIPLDIEKLSDAYACAPTSSEAVWQSRLNSAARAADALGRADFHEFLRDTRQVLRGQT